MLNIQVEKVPFLFFSNIVSVEAILTCQISISELGKGAASYLFFSKRTVSVNAV